MKSGLFGVRLKEMCGIALPSPLISSSRCVELTMTSNWLVWSASPITCVKSCWGFIMNDERLVVSAMFDKSTVSGRGRTIRYLAVEVRTTDRPKPEKTRLPLNIALVVDASTSMAGAPMRAAKRAAAGVVNLLKSSDRLSLISFANDVQVHLQGVKQNARGRDRALDAIDAIEHRLYTNISGGWLKGAEAVAATMEMQPDAHNHVVLLSDGHANHGILDPLIIRNHAQQLRLRSLNTSTVGIGNNYSATLLQELAEFGGGRMHDAEHPAEII